MPTWGANGTIVTNPSIWHVTNWYLWPGSNSVISNSIHVGPAGAMVARLTASNCSNCSSGGLCDWLLQSTDEDNGLVASMSIWSGVSFDTLLGSVMEVPRAVGCVETPANGNAAFGDLAVSGYNGRIKPDVRHVHYGRAVQRVDQAGG